MRIVATYCANKLKNLSTICAHPPGPASPRPLAMMHSHAEPEAAPERSRRTHVCYSAHDYGHYRLPLLVDETATMSPMLVAGWQVTKIQVSSAGSSSGRFIDPFKGGQTLTWSPTAGKLRKGAVPADFDIFILVSTQHSDYKVFAAPQMDEMLTGNWRRMRGILNLGLDVRVFRVCIPLGEDTGSAFASILPNLPACHRHARYGSLCLLHAWPDVSDVTKDRGMFPAETVYKFMTDCEHYKVRLGQPGMHPNLYRLFSSKRCRLWDAAALKNLKGKIRVPPTTTIVRGEDAAVRAAVQRVVTNYGDKLVTSQGEHVGKSGDMDD